MTSNVSSIDIARRIIAHCYGTSATLQPLVGSNHPVFRVAVDDRRYVLKLASNADGRSIAKERWLIELLAGRDIPVPIHDRSEIDSGRLGWPFLCTHCAGTSTVFDAIRHRGREKYELFRQMGEIQARFHQIEFESDGELSADGISMTGPGQYWIELQAWAQQLSQMRLLDPEEADTFLAIPAPPASGRRLCHSDYHAVQCVVSEGRISAVVDWESAWSGNHTIDLAITLAYLDFYAPPELTKRFREAYAQIHPLPEDFDHASLPVRMAQTLAVLRAWHQRGPKPWASAIDSQRVARVLELFRRYRRDLRTT